MVEDDIEAERKAAEVEEYGEEEEAKAVTEDDGRKPSHRGRGGFTGNRGDRNDEDYYGSKPAKRSEPKGEWGEFEGSDDDDEGDNAAYAKPSRGGGQ